MKVDQSDEIQVAIVGAGAFGTALASVIAKANRAPVALLSRDTGTVAAILETRRNERSLPGADLPAGVHPTIDSGHLRQARHVLLAVPAQCQREAAGRLITHLAPRAELVICAKGIEQATGRFLSEAVAEAAPGHPISCLSGPGFAADIAAGLPTAMTLAADDLARAEATAAALSGAQFRLYASDDPIGVQTGGALKNVLAIACGIVEGAGLGQSARAALIARGLAELSRFAVAAGGRAETTSGLSGLGDLVLTGTSEQSRNYRFGVSLGRGQPLADLIAPGAPLSEGAFTATIAARRAENFDISMPITQAVALILSGRLDVPRAIEALMSRPLTTETG
jgi:glycerol-3-phosphate dehydrogenase (NAD(P)+)